MHHLGRTKTKETREIEQLVQQGPHIGIAADPLESGGKAGFHWNKRDGIALLLKLADQRVRLGALTAHALHAPPYDGDPRQRHVMRLHNH